MIPLDFAEFDIYYNLFIFPLTYNMTQFLSIYKREHLKFLCNFYIKNRLITQ